MTLGIHASGTYETGTYETMTTDRSVQLIARHLCKRFQTNGSQVTAYQDLNIEVESGEFFCILGPSGCGKTSFLRTVAGLEQQTSGELICEPRPGRHHSNIGMVFQEQSLFPWMSVSANVRFPLENNPRLKQDDLQGIVDDMLQQVGLSAFAHLYPHQLSGGMRQRVSIARSFANQPDLLLMDEPFVFLDFQTRLSLQSLLLKLWRETRHTIVFVTHDIYEAVMLADRVMVMTAHPGRVKQIVNVDLPRPRDVLSMPQSRQYNDYVEQLTQLIRDEWRDEIQPTAMPG